MFSKIVHFARASLTAKCEVRYPQNWQRKINQCPLSSQQENPPHLKLRQNCSAKETKLRTHRCGQVNEHHVGSTVRLSGWLEYKRGNTFFTMRDATGNCQILCELDVKLPTKESVVTVEGTVQFRPEKDKTRAMATGDIEIYCTEFEVLNKCKNLVYLPNNFSGVKEETRMRHRYLDIRSDRMQRNLRLRSTFILELRKYLCEEHGFVDVETPTLFRKTPGGAQEFVVPTQRLGMFYSLPQSPQQFKQLLMAGGIDRYMQVARCYRDEGSKPDRQPEFTQLDLELSFSSQEQIIGIVEDMLLQCWPKQLPKLSCSFPRMSYQEAIKKYGTDKPDTRYGCTIQDLCAMSHLPVFKFGNKSEQLMEVNGINIKDGCTRLKSKQIKDIQQRVQTQHSVNVGVVRVGKNGEWDSPLTKYVDDHGLPLIVNQTLSASQNDLLFICGHESWKTSCEALGKCRSLAAMYSADNGQPLYNCSIYNFLWIEDFPLFEEENGNIHSAHHPFTAPVDEDFQLLSSDPLKVRGQHYDLVLNGCEIGGGSIRIHDSEVQRYVLEGILKEDAKQLEHLLEALDSGCPPHGGIALGLDRLLSIMCGAPSIRDVIAFPKSTEGTDLMCNAPNEISEEDLKTYHVSIVDH